LNTESTATLTPTTITKTTLDARLDAEVQRQEDVEQGLGILMRLPENATHGALRNLLVEDRLLLLKRVN
jgi:hypothetical protein